MNDAPRKTPEPVSDYAASRARDLGFRIKPAASELTRDLRDALLSLASADYQSSDCAGPVARPIVESLIWLAVGGIAWLLIALMQ